MQQKIKALEEQEQTAWSEKRASKIAAQEAALIQKQQKEVAGLQTRLQKAQDELQQEFKAEQSKLGLKCQNLLKHLIGNGKNEQALGAKPRTPSREHLRSAKDPNKRSPSASSCKSTRNSMSCTRGISMWK